MVNIDLFRVVLIFCLLFAGSVVQALAPGQTFDVQSPESAYGQSIDFSIYRDDKPVGRHSVEFVRSDSGLQVLVESRIVVTFLKVPVYKFNYNSEEFWRDGVLISAASVIVEKGETKEVSLRLDGAEQTLIDLEGKRSRGSLDYTSNHWNPGVLGSTTLFNTLTGRANRYTLTEVGEEKLNVGGAELKASRYRYDGELKSEVWYDEQGRWVQLRFAADDGSTIEYRLDAPFRR